MLDRSRLCVTKTLLGFIGRPRSISLPLVTWLPCGTKTPAVMLLTIERHTGPCLPRGQISAAITSPVFEYKKNTHMFSKNKSLIKRSSMVGRYQLHFVYRCPQNLVTDIFDRDWVHIIFLLQSLLPLRYLLNNDGLNDSGFVLYTGLPTLWTEPTSVQKTDILTLWVVIMYTVIFIINVYESRIPLEENGNDKCTVIQYRPMWLQCHRYSK